MLTFNDYVDILKSGEYRPICKISWLRREDESIYDEFTADIISGSLTINKNNGARRSVNMTLQNIDGKYIPDEYGLWIRHKFFLEIGLKYGNETIFFPQGVFVLSNPEIVSNFSEKIANISGVDKFSLLDGQLGGELDSIYEIPGNSDINDALREILSNDAGDKKSPILQELPTVGGIDYNKTPFTLREEISGTYGTLTTKIAEMVSREVYYNELGHFVFEKPKRDTELGSMWDYKTSEFLYLGGTRKFDFDKVYNHVIVIGDNINGETFVGKATNENLQSSTRIQLIGKRTKVIEDDIIYTTDLAEQRAVYELNRLIAVQDGISSKSIPMYHLDVDKVITFKDETVGLNGDRYLIQSLNIPFKAGEQMTITSTKALGLNIE